MQRRRFLKDRFAKAIMLIFTVLSILLMFFIVLALYYRSRPILALKPLSELLLSSSWRPLKGNFGFFPFIMGTFWVTGVSMVIAVPICILAAIYLSEYAHRKLKETLSPLIDLLSGIPSVVYGMWGVLFIVPLIKNHFAPLFGVSSTGYSVLAGGIVLAIMICPVIVHVCIEVFKSVPREVREASLSLGATKWQTVKHVILRKAMPGVIAAIILGLSRALGETMAVLMVVGNVARSPHSIFDPAYPIPALIANNYGEMLSIPLYDSALLFASLLLLLVVLAFNIVSQIILVKIQKYIQ
jgi:phosphate transport system permease protein